MSSTRPPAQERVAAYYESCLRGLIEHVGIAMDQYRADGDAEQMNTALYQYHRAARELWKFCWLDGGGSQLEFIASLIDASAPAVDWWQRGAPRRPKRG
ncbi:MAG TPA: hypothetical protein VII50_05655 [Acidothermaceae bacterium]